MMNSNFVRQLNKLGYKNVYCYLAVPGEEEEINEWKQDVLIYMMNNPRIIFGVNHGTHYKLYSTSNKLRIPHSKYIRVLSKTVTKNVDLWLLCYKFFKKCFRKKYNLERIPFLATHVILNLLNFNEESEWYGKAYFIVKDFEKDSYAHLHNWEVEELEKFNLL